MLEGIEEEEEEEESPSSWHKMTTMLEIIMISDSGYKSRHSQPECGYALEPSQWTEYSIHTMDPDNLVLTFEFFEVRKSLVLFNRKILSTIALQSILMEFLNLFTFILHESFWWLVIVMSHLCCLGGLEWDRGSGWCPSRSRGHRMPLIVLFCGEWQRSGCGHPTYHEPKCQTDYWKS